MTSVNGGIVIISGVILIEGVYLITKEGEKIEEVARTASQRKKDEVCYYNPINGRFRNHFIMKS